MADDISECSEKASALLYLAGAGSLMRPHTLCCFCVTVRSCATPRSRRFLGGFFLVCVWLENWLANAIGRRSWRAASPTTFSPPAELPPSTCSSTLRRAREYPSPLFCPVLSS